MANILVSMYNFARDPQNYNVMPPFYEAFVEGLRKAGNNVFCFFHKKYDMDFSGKIPFSLQEAMKRFSPDLAIFFDNNFWDITGIFDIPVVVYDVDSPLYIKNKEQILAHPDRYCFITIQKNDVNLLHELFHVSSADVAYMEPFTEIRSDDSVSPEYNISFVGANWLWGGASFAVELNRHLSSEDREKARQVLSRFMENPLTQPDEEYASTTARLIVDAKECSNRLSGIKRARILSAVADLGLELRGLYWDHASMNYYPELALCYNKDSLFSLSDNQDFYNRSRIGICTQHIQAVSGFSWRVCDIMASNACLVTEYRPDMSELFGNVDIPMFSTPAEAHRQCRELLEQESLRKEIVEQCHAVIDARFRFRHLLEKLEAFLQMNLSSAGEGIITYFSDKDLENALVSDTMKQYDLAPESVTCAHKKSSNAPEDAFRGDEFCSSIEEERRIRFKATLQNLFTFSHHRRRERRHELLDRQYEAERRAALTSDLPFAVHMANYLGRKADIRARAKFKLNDQKKKQYIQKHEHELAGKYKACARVDWYMHEQEEDAARVRMMRDIAKKRRLRVAFLVVYDSVFPAEAVYRKMRESKVFEPVLYVIPDTLRGEQNMLTQMFKTYKSLKEKYGEVFLTYDIEHKTFTAIEDSFDIFCTANPYDTMTHVNYRVRHLTIERGKLSFYINYGYPGVSYGREVFAFQAMSLVWKYFIESEALFPEYRRHEILYGLNTEIVGYPKMDALAQCRIDTKRTFKRVIIAPHHTIEDSASIQISTFLLFADMFLELPARYPEVQFVFRPHPMLFPKLADDKFWGREKAEKYLATMKAFPNVEYQDGGDYFETFANADGIIHDCSSFLTEWMYTEKPGCYLLRNRESIGEQFMPAGQAVLDLYYQAFCEEDIIRFLDDVILRGEDPLKEKRESYVRRYIKVNYPDASGRIVSYLEEQFLSGEKS